jgi:hypothetical protein
VQLPVCAYAQQSNTTPLELWSAQFQHKTFCIFFITWGLATDIKLKDYILYKYKERIKEKSTHCIICYR